MQDRENAFTELCDAISTIIRENLEAVCSHNDIEIDEDQIAEIAVVSAHDVVRDTTREDDATFLSPLVSAWLVLLDDAIRIRNDDLSTESDDDLDPDLDIDEDHDDSGRPPSHVWSSARGSIRGETPRCGASTPPRLPRRRQ